MPAFVLQKVLLPLYFARADTTTPFRISVFSMFVNAAVAVGLMQQFGYLSAAIGATAAAWIMLLMLWMGSRRMGIAAKPDSRLLRHLPRILIATALMGALVWGLAQLAEGFMREPGVRYVYLTALVGAGMLFYGLTLVLFRVYEFRSVLELLRRPRG